MTLVSPGVSVTVTDESFYASAGAGTVPLIVIATAQDKASPDGSGVAPFSTKAEAGKLKLISSQRELLQGYGNPIFYRTGSSPRHGFELNEYGLQAAYSYLGASNRAFVLRADVDLGLLQPSATPPGALPENGTYWLNLSTTRISVRRWSGSAWVLQTPLFPLAAEMASNDGPRQSFGLNNSFAVVTVDENGQTLPEIKVWQKLGGVWFLVGSNAWNGASSNEVQFGTHTSIPVERAGGGALTAGDVFVQINQPNQGTVLDLSVYDRSRDQFVSVPANIFSNSTQAYDAFGANLNNSSVAAFHDAAEASFQLFRHSGAAQTTVLGSSFVDVDLDDALGNVNTVAFQIVSDNGTAISVTFDNAALDDATPTDVVSEINKRISEAQANSATRSDALIAEEVAGGRIRFVNSNGRDIELVNVETGFLALIGLAEGVYSNWVPLSYVASFSRPVGEIADGTLWFDNRISLSAVDLLVKDSSGWVSFSGDLQISASAPALNSTGGALAPGDLWIDTSDLENYPHIKRWSGSAWVTIDKTDQVTGDGIIFADFRSTTANLDDDAPNANLYPNGILGWNKRLSGGNVKVWNGATSRWDDASGNSSDGVPFMLRKAQRKIIVNRLQAAVNSNQELRNETNRFNLIAVPGYVELIDEMIQLNTDRKETAFIIADSPMRLAPDGSSVSAWANNTNNAPENGDRGLVSASPFAAVYYPHGLTSGLDGSNIFVPASHIALRTIARNDQVSFPWFAPAGFQRGLVENASAVGYVDAVTGAFVPVSLNEGKRDTLYLNRINPIAAFPGRGLAVFGQKTLSPTASALDRVNVARLVVFLRERLDDIVRGFLFEPNDEVTRANAKSLVERFLGQILSQRGLFDFVVVCDETNNTPARIDRNELYIDVAVQPAKAIEFIYIPIRIQTTQGANN
jgi:hypothetical protein